MKKLITTIILIVLCLSSFLSIFPINVKAVQIEVLTASYPFTATTGYEYLLAVHPSATTYFSGWFYTFTASEAGELSKIRLMMATNSSLGLNAQVKCSIYNTTGSLNSYPQSLLGTSGSTGLANNMPKLPVTFDFVGSGVNLTVGTKYAFFVYLYSASNVDINTDRVLLWTQASSNTAEGYSGTYKSSAFSNLGTYDEIGFEAYVYQGTPEPSPTPATPSGTIKINFAINPSATYGNFTMCLPPATNYVDIDSSNTFFYNIGTTVLFLPKLASGWYFWNYTLITNTGYNLTYPINNWAIELDETLGTVWNITMGISQTRNAVDIKLTDVTHGTIYFQNYVDSVPSGIRYGAGTYNITYATVIYISTLPDSGYKTDYFTVVANGLTSQVTGSYLTFIASSNATITPHYIKDDASGVTNGSGSFLSFWNTLTWQNIAVIIIYAICCGLCAYAFAFTGLIAGLDIATAICFLTGLLGDLMYPVLGLIIICNIALIIVGSGLLNKKSNGVDA